VRRWAVAGALAGAAAAAGSFAPAAWLATALADATNERLLLADARGTVWHGSGVLVLTGGAGSRDASALPGRIQWGLSLEGWALALRARHACCINGELVLRLVPGLGRMRLELPPSPGAIGQWPAAWLVGLGTPWNTLQPSGSLRLSSGGLTLERVQGRWLFSGQAELELAAMASRVCTLDVLGSYRLALHGDAARGVAATVQLSTTEGALQLGGSGQWSASKLRFTGQASAAPGAEAALSNLLNIIGRRQGALSLISIG
jgi:general secretion pathway protein N